MFKRAATAEIKPVIPKSMKEMDIKPMNFQCECSEE